jgi:hypothetical protein
LRVELLVAAAERAKELLPGVRRELDLAAQEEAVAQRQVVER